MSEAVLACLEDLAGPDISVAISAVGSEDGLLDPEPLAVTRAVAKRRAEFAAGRRAARTAMRKAGYPEAAIPQGPRRAPVWPDGLVGSLSHDSDLAIAGIAPASKLAGLGLDLTEAADFPERLRSEVLKTAQETQQSGLEARLSFSAKETVFKSLFPQVQEFFGFAAVEILPDMRAGRFAVRLRQALGPYPAEARFEGRFAIIDRHLMTLLAIPA